MKHLIIYCHPSKDSHNAKILRAVERFLKAHHQQYEVVDLYREHFEPCFSQTEYQRMRSRDVTLEPDVLLMQRKIGEADHLIFVYPNWWYGMPARLKGFMDRVITPGFAYRFKKVPELLMWGANLLSFLPGLRYLMQPYTVHGLLKGKKASIFRTFGGPSSGKRIFGNTPVCLEQVVLRFCGITDIRVHELYNVDKHVFTDEYFSRYLKALEPLLSRALQHR